MRRDTCCWATNLPTDLPTYLPITYRPLYLPTCIPTYPPTYLPIPTDLHTDLPTYPPTDLYTYRPLYLPTYTKSKQKEEPYIVQWELYLKITAYKITTPWKSYFTYIRKSRYYAWSRLVLRSATATTTTTTTTTATATTTTTTASNCFLMMFKISIENTLLCKSLSIYLI